MLLRRLQDWFSETLADKPAIPVVDAGLEHLCIAVMSTGEVTEEVSESLTQLTHRIVAADGTVIVPANAEWLSAISSQQSGVPLTNTHQLWLMGSGLRRAGFHIMETPTDQPTETLTGLGATGVDLALAHIVGAPLQSHVMVPLIQVSTDATTQSTYGADLDSESADVEELLTLIVEGWPRGGIRRICTAKRNNGFPLTPRGCWGISM